MASISTQRTSEPTMLRAARNARATSATELPVSSVIR